MSALTEFTLDDLQRLESANPGFGRIEIIGGLLWAGGTEMTGDRHQSTVQSLFEVLLPLRPVGFVLRLDTYWFSGADKIRPDMAIWREADRPTDGGAFRLPPVIAFEILSSDADHDLVAKAAIYRARGVLAVFLDPAQRHGWWCRIAPPTGAGTDHHDESIAIAIPEWPPIVIPLTVLTA